MVKKSIKNKSHTSPKRIKRKDGVVQVYWTGKKKTKGRELIAGPYGIRLSTLARTREEDWVTDILANDDVNGDEELVDYFMEEGKMSKKKAKFYVSQRPNFNRVGGIYYELKKYKG